MDSFDNLLSFLKYTKTNYKTAKGVVIGNMAMDLDSTISSIVYAYFKTKTGGELFIPVINIPKEEVKFRTDVSFVLREHKIDREFLIYEPDIRNFLVTNRKSLEIVLVDHNVAKYPFIDRNVVEIIDHHVNESFFEETCKKRNIELVGSCCTLISLEITSSHPDFFHDEKLCTELLFNVIVSDTVNMDPKINKAREKDVKVINELQSLLGFRDSQRKDIHDTIKRQYFNVSELTDLEVLDSDYKHFGEVFGICSCRRMVSDLQHLETYRNKKNVKLLFSMIQSMNEKEEFCRDLVIYQQPPLKESDTKVFKFDDIIKFLNHEKLDLEVLDRKEDVFVLMRQKNKELSRKLVSPLLKNFL